MGGIQKPTNQMAAAARRFALNSRTTLVRPSSIGDSMRRRFASSQASEQTAFETLYKTCFSSNASYVTYVVVGAIAFEAVYGKVTDFVWENANRGRLYHHIDWSQFKTDDDEDDEE